MEAVYALTLNQKIHTDLCLYCDADLYSYEGTVGVSVPLVLHFCHLYTLDLCSHGEFSNLLQLYLFLTWCEYLLYKNLTKASGESTNNIKTIRLFGTGIMLILVMHFNSC